MIDLRKKQALANIFTLKILGGSVSVKCSRMSTKTVKPDQPIRYKIPLNNNVTTSRNER